MNADMERIRLGRTWAHYHFPYLAPAVHALTLIRSERVRTMGVDKRWRCYWNPKALDAWTVPQIGSVLIHEVWHCLREHFIRAETLGIYAHPIGELLNLIWNIAADCEINDDEVQERIDLPGDYCLPKKFSLPDGQTAEWYFEKLQEDGGARLKGRLSVTLIYGGSCADGCGRDYEGDADDERDGPGISQSEAKLIAREVAKAIQTASAGRGNFPEGAVRWAAEVLAPPTVPWQSEISALLRSACAHVAGSWDYTYCRPSRRQTGDVVLPSMHRPVPEIAAVIDTSGSMSDEAIGVAVNELGGLLRRSGATIRVLSVDAAVHQVQKAFGRVDRKLLGAGGTDMALGITSAAKLHPKPDIIVVLTDGYTGWPRAAPTRSSVLVVLLTEGDGRVVRRSVPSWARCVEVDVSELEDTVAP